MGHRGGGAAGDAATAALVGFRSAFHGCLSGWGDALFELADATLDAPAGVGSVPALSLEPVFRRSHGRWWADEQGGLDLRDGFGLPLESGPICGGEAGATVGLRRSTATRGSRIAGNHLGGTIRGSTFRWTLAAILRTSLQLEPIGRRHLSTDSEARLSAWIREHLGVTLIAFPDRDEIDAFETAVLARLDPPLNIAKMAPTALRARLSCLRSTLVATAGGHGATDVGPRSTPAVPRRRVASARAAPGARLTPDELAADLGLPNGKRVRQFLRDNYPREAEAWHSRWGPLPPDLEAAVRRRFGSDGFGDAGKGRR